MIAKAKTTWQFAESSHFVDEGLLRAFLRPGDLPLPPQSEVHDLRLMSDGPERVAQSCGFLFSSKRMSDYAAANGGASALQAQSVVQGVRLSTIIDIRMVFADSMWAQRFSDEAIDWLSEKAHLDMQEIDGPRVADVAAFSIATSSFRART